MGKNVDFWLLSKISKDSDNESIVLYDNNPLGLNDKWPVMRVYTTLQAHPNFSFTLKALQFANHIIGVDPGLGDSSDSWKFLDLWGSKIQKMVKLKKLKKCNWIICHDGKISMPEKQKHLSKCCESNTVKPIFYYKTKTSRDRFYSYLNGEMSGTDFQIIKWEFIHLISISVNKNHTAQCFEYSSQVFLYEYLCNQK